MLPWFASRAKLAAGGLIDVSHRPDLAGPHPDPRPVVLSPEGKAMIARLDEMYRDVYHLTHEEWKAKWRPDTPRP